MLPPFKKHPLRLRRLLHTDTTASIFANLNALKSYSRRHRQTSSDAPAPASSLSSCPTDQVDDVIIELDGGGKMTLNATGIEMSVANPLVKFWAQSFDGIHPIVDIGCAYGRNIQAAHNILKDKITVDNNNTFILACDCNKGHLDAVKNLQLPGVETVYARLPENFPSQIVASGILMGEVLHFLSGEAIEKTLVSVRDTLVSGGVLAITACSPFMNFAPDERSGVCPINSIIQQLYEKNIKRRWPVGNGVNLQTLLTGRNLDGQGDVAIRRMPSYFHPFAAKDLKRALEETGGFRVISAEERWHPGYPPQYMHEGKENTQILAVKE